MIAQTTLVRVEQIMGMPISVHLAGTEPFDDVTTTAALDAFFDQLRWVDATFSTSRADSVLSGLGRGEVLLAECHPAVSEVIELCFEAQGRTFGAFDAEVAQPDGATRFDPSGLVKGWGVERASAQLQRLEHASWCVNAGGDVVAGSNADEPKRWRIGIEDPTDTNRMLAVVELTDGAVATSGRAHRGSHIIDPLTGRPADSVLSATVIGPTLMWTDVYATALAVRGSNGLAWIDSLPEHDALVMDSDEVLHSTLLHSTLLRTTLLTPSLLAP